MNSKVWWLGVSQCQTFVFRLNSSVVPYCYFTSPYAGRPRDVENSIFYTPKTIDVVKFLLASVGWNRLKGCHLTTGEFNVFWLQENRNIPFHIS